ncbi:dynein regulatory complex protein 9-like [Periplaneta americana]|uniref:dynein regulatory complex protein 9-like n=1 Tax=Periplaneta americana TaxID=6978 RepID=UPI0037E8DAC7
MIKFSENISKSADDKARQGSVSLPAIADSSRKRNEREHFQATSDMVTRADKSGQSERKIGFLSVPGINVKGSQMPGNSSLSGGADDGDSTDTEEKLPKTMSDIVMLAKSAVEREMKLTKGHSAKDVLKTLPTPSENVIGQMSKIERIGIITVLEDCIDQLYILGKTNSKPHVSPELNYKDLRERFADRLRFRVDVEETEPNKQFLNKSKKFNKLQGDRATLELVLRLTLDELKMNNSFTSLIQVNKAERKKRDDEADLIREQQQNLQEMNRLRNSLKKELKEGNEKLNTKHEVIAQLKDEIQDTLFTNDLKYKYISHWEQAREEQNTQRLALTEKHLEDRFVDLKDHINMELRCHTEIEDYIREATTSLEEQIQQWMEKYENEMEQRDNELQKLRDQRAAEYTKLEELALLYQQRQDEMKAYLAYKEEQAAKAAHQAYLNRMATCIQAWWRGTMVRRGLGPYKKTKKGKDKKGKGKGKGGSKKK